LISSVVTPSASRLATRGALWRSRSTTLAARVARTVDMMPPPARAMSS
jgi:hypothetical protein